QGADALMLSLAAFFLFGFVDEKEAKPAETVPAVKSAAGLGEKVASETVVKTPTDSNDKLPENVLVDRAVGLVGTAKQEAVELSAVAVQAPIDLTKVLLGPIRDSYQLIPGYQEPVLPVPTVKDDPLGVTNLMIRDANPMVAAKWKYRVEGGGN